MRNSHAVAFARPNYSAIAATLCGGTLAILLWGGLMVSMFLNSPAAHSVNSIRWSIRPVYGSGSSGGSSGGGSSQTTTGQGAGTSSGSSGGTPSHPGGQHSPG